VKTVSCGVVGSADIIPEREGWNTQTSESEFQGSEWIADVRVLDCVRWTQLHLSVRTVFKANIQGRLNVFLQIKVNCKVVRVGSGGIAARIL